MEKTTHVHIASVPFTLTEIAYEKLSRYLGSLKEHFAAEDTASDIIADIESRIAEKLLEKKHRVISEADIDTVIGEIGEASQFEEEPAAGVSNFGHRKLYRDPDTALIGGVASGIAAYFGIDPLIPRLLFLSSIFFGGAGIVIYLLLWLLIPEAKSASQKLEMRGHAVTLENISRFVKGRVHEERERGTFKKILYLPFEIIGALVQFVTKRILPLLGRVFAALIAAGSFIAILALTTGAGIVLTNWNAPYNDFPLRAAVTPSLLASAFAVGYIAILIPIVFIFSFGYRILRRSTLIAPAVGFGLIGIWSLSLIACGVIGTKIAGQYYSYTESAPEYQMTKEVQEIGMFDSIRVDGMRVQIKNGSTREVSIEGRALDMENARTQVESGALVVSRTHRHSGPCIFCRDVAPTVTITTPHAQSITVQGGSIRFEDFAQDSLALEADSGSIRGSLRIPRLTAKLMNSSLNSTLTSKELILSAEDSYGELRGTAQSADITLLHSTLNADRFTIETAKLSAEHSSARMRVTGELEKTISDSAVFNAGARIED